MNLIDYFDRISIIHLPEREDRYKSMRHELRSLGIDIKHPKIEIPFAPRPDHLNGFQSRGVYGNMLSHLDILRRALHDGLSSILVLEDDTIFSKRMCRTQASQVETLRGAEWDLCNFGHSLSHELVGQPEGLIPPPHHQFNLAHCYAVHARILPRLVPFIEKTLDRPEGHPEGGKVYIDTAFWLFRIRNPDIFTLVGSPLHSRQKGCFSSLNDRRWYDKSAVTRPVVSAARGARDYWWKVTS
jgi:hypothetical protein